MFGRAKLFTCHVYFGFAVCNTLTIPVVLPVGYGFRSIDYIIRQCIACEESTDKPAFLRKLDDQGVLATPRNSRFNELVVEAGRESILNDGRTVSIRSDSR